MKLIMFVIILACIEYAAAMCLVAKYKLGTTEIWAVMLLCWALILAEFFIVAFIATIFGL